MYTAPSQIAERQIAYFENTQLLILGEIEDTFALELSKTCQQVTVVTSNFLTYQSLVQHEQLDVHFSVTVPEHVKADTLMLYWPKAKAEAKMLLAAALPHLEGDKEVCVVGENRSGVKSIEKQFEQYGSINKFDSARRCSFYWGRVTQEVPKFDLSQWYTTFTVSAGDTDIIVKSLPGVFNHGQLDEGTKLLLANLPQLNGKVLDVGCGAGIIGSIIAKRNPQVTVHLCDISAFAIESSKQTLKANQLEGTVFASNVYSDVAHNYDAIVSNPPFHAGLDTFYEAAETLLGQASAHLHAQGHIHIVANSFLKYPPIIEKSFGHCETVDKNRKFAIYHAQRS
ncbi:16S rRNA (guanine(1207)-N(2))-methyltransferase RsmC [Vibrio ulleungensis]|uniref:Ribosomal RNA small subunit methyltransferase C n=1 Tax=Vibrio ulleungensis TaxID=2807619 RepID=A0ABS2HJY2_9VIBR|nr:16S rRNA (guanine(1207)-N(2))-methyltransferase RsmC [Vibrio ulleungensis]MBM7037820.1 16S rRNA (guanine(1207)-N(2))-methyltransferase RsmC [Vibrio ulleungensis]